MKMEHAKQIYQTLCNALDGRGWHYDTDAEKLLVGINVTGDDLPMRVVMCVDAERQLIQAFSRLPFNMSEDKRMEGAVAVCAATFGMVDGSFDYDLTNGSITFRMTASYMNSKIGEGLFLYLIDCTCAMVDEYNDKFMLLNKGLITITDFINKE